MLGLQMYEGVVRYCNTITGQVMFEDVDDCLNQHGEHFYKYAKPSEGVLAKGILPKMGDTITWFNAPFSEIVYTGFKSDFRNKNEIRKIDEPWEVSCK